jgi:hypothetical protein
MSSQAFHRILYGRVRETTLREQWRSRNLELFNPVAQEYKRDEILQQSTQKNLKKTGNLNSSRDSGLALPWFKL